MSTEIRRVPPDWVHPTDGTWSDGCPRYVELLNGADFTEWLKRWEIGKAAWDLGMYQLGGDASWMDRSDLECESFERWAGKKPDPKDYTPIWSPEEATHFMVYEFTTEGTPLSPVFATEKEAIAWEDDYWKGPGFN
jgi:hypothetical protein